MSYLSDGSNLLEIPMEQLGGENEVRVLIGPENVAEELRDSSVVLATYDAGENMRGLIGVVGPTRMDYSKVAAKLSFIAARPVPSCSAAVRFRPPGWITS